MPLKLYRLKEVLKVTNNKNSFEMKQEELVDRYNPCMLKAKSDRERGEIFIEFVLERERMRHNCFEAGAQRDEIDRRTLSKLANSFALGPEFSRDEAIFRRLVADPASAIRYIDQFHEQNSAAQSERASKPRPKSKDKITEKIEEILSVNLKLSAKAVARDLEDSDEITLIEEEFRHNDDASTLKFSNLPNRVADAKKRLKKDSG